MFKLCFSVQVLTGQNNVFKLGAFEDDLEKGSKSRGCRPVVFFNSMHICRSLTVSACLSVYLSVCLCLSVYLSVCLCMSLPVYQFICMSVSICLSISVCHSSALLPRISLIFSLRTFSSNSNVSGNLPFQDLKKMN